MGYTDPDRDLAEPVVGIDYGLVGPVVSMKDEAVTVEAFDGSFPVAGPEDAAVWRASVASGVRRDWAAKGQVR